MEQHFLNNICSIKRLASLIGLYICLYFTLGLEIFSIKQIILICFCFIDILDVLVWISEKTTKKTKQLNRISKTYTNLQNNLGLGHSVAKLLFICLCALTVAFKIILPFIIYFI